MNNRYEWTFPSEALTEGPGVFIITGHLSPTETDGDMLGYDLYSSALADILSEPTMQPPICVGLYAQWGSGKSFLLKKLEGPYTARVSLVVLGFGKKRKMEIYVRAPAGFGRKDGYFSSCGLTFENCGAQV